MTEHTKLRKDAKTEHLAKEKRYKKLIKRAGYYAFVTSQKGVDATRLYHTLRQIWHIEEFFRVRTTSQEAHSYAVRTPKQIRGLFLICYLALVLERWAHHLVTQAGLDYSGPKVIELLQQAWMNSRTGHGRKNFVPETGDFVQQQEKHQIFEGHR